MRPLLCVLLLVSLSSPVSAQSVMYSNASASSDLAAMKTVGFTGLIVALLSVNANGDIVFGPYTICSGGAYTMDQYLPNYAADMAALKTGISSIRRVEIGVGGWGNASYDNMKALINAQGTGSGSILYRNFAALKAAIPSIDAINDDDEQTYDAGITVAFAVMLADIGFHYTLAPYMNAGHWQNVVTQINSQRPGALDRVYVQCYAGGAGNNPADWQFGVPVYGGAWNYDSPQTVQNSMQSWKNAGSIVGGFMWFENNPNRADWSKPINTVFAVPTQNTEEPGNFYKDVNFGLFTNGLGLGSHNLAELQTLGIDNNDISSLSIMKGFKATLFDGDNCDGASTTLSAGNTGWIGAEWNDRVSSVRLETDGDENCAGLYYLQNRNSGLWLDIGGAEVDNGAAAIQSGFNGNGNQQFAFAHKGGGAYTITAQHSGRVLEIGGANRDAGRALQQWDGNGGEHQTFVVLPTDEGYCRLIVAHCGKVMEVSNARTDAGAGVNQWTNNNQSCGQWKLVPVPATARVAPKAASAALRCFVDPSGNALRFVNGGDVTVVEAFALDGTKMGQWTGGGSDLNIRAWAAGEYVVRMGLKGLGMRELRVVKR